MRNVIYIPAWHTLSERGGRGPYQDILDRDIPNDLREALESEHNRFFKACELYWQDVWKYLHEGVRTGRIDPTKSHVYSDSAAYSWDQMEPLYQKAADEGSHHSRVVLDLVQQGAQHEIAESVETLFAPHEIYEMLVELNGRIDTLSESEERQKLLDERVSLVEQLKDNGVQRDIEIARTIDRTLPEGRTGILILGASHRVSRFLPDTIVFTPLHESLVRLTDGDSGKTEIALSKETESSPRRSSEKR